MRVLITGAAGFLGAETVRQLLLRGHEVRAIVRPGTAVDRFGWASQVELFRADLRTSTALDESLRDIDVVVHAAARVAGSDEERFASTVVGTERLLDAMSRSSVRRLVLISSYSVYDWSRATRSLHEESSVLNRPYGRDGYAVAKVWQERLVREAAAAQSFELTVLRPGFIWGPGNLEIAGAGVPMAGVTVVVSPRAELPLTYIENCAACVVSAVEKPAAAGDTFNVVDGHRISAWRFAGDCKRFIGGGNRVPVPYVLARLLVAMISWVSRNTSPYGGKLPSVLVPENFDARFKPLEHTAERAARVLEWTASISYSEAWKRVMDRHDHGAKA